MTVIEGRGCALIQSVNGLIVNDPATGIPMAFSTTEQAEAWLRA
jgi:hypothetical protein